MSNRKKLKAHNGATRIVPMAGKHSNLYGVQYYDGITGSWEDVDGLFDLTWEEAQRGRHNYVTLRDACKVANNGVIKLHVPNEGNGN
nr:MAG TPA: hypothetical protein [Bacteriophage sp.]